MLQNIKHIYVYHVANFRNVQNSLKYRITSEEKQICLRANDSRNIKQLAPNLQIPDSLKTMLKHMISVAIWLLGLTGILASSVLGGIAFNILKVELDCQEIIKHLVRCEYIMLDHFTL